MDDKIEIPKPPGLNRTM